MNTRTRLAACAVALLALVPACAGDDDDAADEPATLPDSSQASLPGPTEPNATEPAANEPTASEPTATEPTVTEPADEETSFSVYISEPASIDPAMSQEVEGAQVIRLLFEPLVQLDAELNVVPGVAIAWERSADGLTWTFDLDPAATFSDGRPIVADDFAFAFARAADPDLAAPAAYQGSPILGWDDVMGGEPSGAVGDQPIEGLASIDDHTLAITTTEPFALLPKVLTYPTFAPVAPEYVDGEDAAAAFAEQPIGNGPYTMDGPWDHNVGIDVVRNPTYHGRPGRADRIQFRVYADAHTAYVDFQAGNLDIARILAPEDVEGARSSYPDTFAVTPTASLGYIGLPTRLPPFDNPDIRLALSLAIDRQAISDRIWSGTMLPANGVVPPQAPGADPQCAGCRYDPERAAELWEQAGGVPGNTMIVYDIADDGQAQIEAIVNGWKDVLGVDVELRSFEFSRYLEETAADVVQGPFELGWVWDYPSGYSIVAPLFESTSGANNLGYANEELDARLAEVRQAPDEEAGLPALAQAQHVAEADLPLLPVVFTAEVGVHSDRLDNVFVDAGFMYRLEDVEVIG